MIPIYHIIRRCSILQHSGCHTLLYILVRISWIRSSNRGGFGTETCLLLFLFFPHTSYHIIHLENPWSHRRPYCCTAVPILNQKGQQRKARNKSRPMTSYICTTGYTYSSVSIREVGKIENCTSRGLCKGRKRVCVCGGGVCV